MSDDFMKHLRRDPPPELEARLRERLSQAGEREEPMAEEPMPIEGARRYLRPALVAAGIAAVVVGFVLSPALRASAQAFLDLFRVRNFTAVTVDPTRIQRLNDQKLDLKALLGGQIQETEKPGPPRAFLDAASAGAAAGIQVRVPRMIPNGMTGDTVWVQGAAAATGTVDERKIRSALDGLGLSDVRLPQGMDGKRFSVHVPPVVRIAYRRGTVRANLLQSRSPDVSLPAGLDLSQLGEIGLRVLGLPESEAHRVAGSIDWRTTMVVPVPANAGSFREVNVSGHKALLITLHERPAEGQRRALGGSVLMWSEGDKVYAVTGNASSEDLLLMAGSLQ